MQDAGPGLPEAEQAHVFDRFYRADAARGRDSGGLGLGLTIAKAIVDAHRGTISVQSAPGKGCTFAVRLPPRVADGVKVDARQAIAERVWPAQSPGLRPATDQILATQADYEKLARGFEPRTC